MNLLQETINNLTGWGYRKEDVKWVGSADYAWCTWDEFAEVARDTCYDNGWGSQEIAEDLVVVLKDGAYMHRSEDDGAEWWDLAKTPRKPRRHEPTMRFGVGSHSRLSELQETREKDAGH